jgi:GTP-dependent phosphoenolpyruvate carboxykinase
MARKGKPFWDRVKKGAQDECWEWQGYRDKNGYGHLTVHQEVKLAHRYAWEDIYGSLPDWLYVLHKCDNPSCVNPEHLILGTQQDNLADCVAKGRASGGSMPGELNPSAKITAIQAREIYISRNRFGNKLRVIAEKYGITPQAVHLIAKGIKWSSVTSGIDD